MPVSFFFQYTFTYNDLQAVILYIIIVKKAVSLLTIKFGYNRTTSPNFSLCGICGGKSVMLILQKWRGSGSDHPILSHCQLPLHFQQLLCTSWCSAYKIQTVHIMAIGAQNPSAFMGWSTFNANTKTDAMCKMNSMLFLRCECYTLRVFIPVWQHIRQLENNQCCSQIDRYACIASAFPRIRAQL